MSIPSSPPPLTPPLFALSTGCSRRFPSSPRASIAASRRERPSPARQELRTAAPLVAIVRPSKALRERSHEAAATLGAIVFCADLVSLAADCHARSPAAILVTEEVLAIDPRGFSALARELGARLVQLQDEHVPREALIAALRYVLSTRA